jgi:hypothetical protein
VNFTGDALQNIMLHEALGNSYKLLALHNIIQVPVKRRIDLNYPAEALALIDV